MTKAAILTRERFRSPKFLAYGLSRMLSRLGIESDVFPHGIGWLEAIACGHLSRRHRVQAIKANWRLRRLSAYDLIFIVDTHRAFREVVNPAPLKKMGKPVLHYTQHYVGGEPYWLERLPDDATTKYDAYLVVTGIHDAPPINFDKLFVIGADISPEYPFVVNREFKALLDFAYPGYEKERELQHKVLNELGIDTVTLSGEYTFKEIENVYKSVAIAFLACPEALSISFIQLQHHGAYVACPEPWWVRHHALLPKGSVYKWGKIYKDNDSEAPKFTKNFIFYKDEDGLRLNLEKIRADYKPSLVRQRLLEQQQAFCNGNLGELWAAIEFVS